MPQHTSAAQVQAYRFGTRRLAHALEHGSAELVPFAGPRRGVALGIGSVLAGLTLAGFAVYGIVRPAPAVGDAKVLVDADQGGAYVVRDGVVHPALNIASAMLAAVDDQGGGANGSVRQVNAETLRSMPRGETVGIPGAPTQVPTEAQLVPDTWQVCDTAAPDPAAAPGTRVTPRTTVVLGRPLPPTSTSRSLLVTADGKTHYLVWAGHRSRIGTGADDAVAGPLGLDLRDARPVSAAFLNSVAEQPPLTLPAVPGAGTRFTSGFDATVGDVVTAPQAGGGTRLLLVLADGLQPVTPVVADLVRARTGQAEVRAVTPAQVAAAGISASPLDLDRYPTTRPVVVDQAEQPVVCRGWANVGGTVTTTLTTAARLPLPAGARTVPAPPGAQEDGTVATDTYVAPGGGLVVQASVDGTGTAATNTFLVTDQGVHYPVDSPGALASLGLGKTVSPVPGQLVALLPLGPALDPAAARGVRPQAPGAQG